MAFNPALLTKLQPSTLFTQPATIPSVQPAKVAVQIWTYNAGNDNLTTVSANGYFVYFADWLNTLEYNNGQFLQVGDLIYCVCSNGTQWLTVLTIGTTITTSIGLQSVSASQFVRLTVTAAQFNGAFAAPVLVVPAPGFATSQLSVDRMVVNGNFGTLQFAGGGAVALQYDSTIHGAGTLATASIPAATINGWAANSSIMVAGVLPSSPNTTTVNKGLYLSNLAGAFTTGDGTFDLQVFYSTTTV